MKKLPRQIVRNEDKPGYSKTIWQPSWKCYCCRDKGIVSNHLAVRIIEGFNHRTDQMPYCQNPSCGAGEYLLINEEIEKVLDMRLNAAICQELDLIERQDWQQMLHQQYQNQLRAMEMVDQLASKKSLRQRARTPEEEQSALTKHEENLLSSPREQDKLHTAVYGGEL
jgi:hypothetical protein